MESQTIKMNRWIFVLCFLYNAGMVFYSLLPGIAVVAVSVIFFWMLFSKIRKYHGTKMALLACIVASIPTSFLSIVATSYSALPVNWFTIFILLLLAYIVAFEKFQKNYLIFLLLYISFFLLNFFKVAETVSAIKQGIMIFLFLLSFPIGCSMVKKIKKEHLELVQQLYVISVFSVALQIILQLFYKLFFSQVIGMYDIMAARVAYAGLFSDYSFASLYLGTGCLFLLVIFLEKKKMRLVPFLIMEAVLLFALILTTARTGLYSMFLIGAVYVIKKMKTLNRKTIPIFIAIIVAVPVFWDLFIQLRGSTDLFNSSGRIKEYLRGLEIFEEHFLMGLGFGIENWVSETGMIIPHNFFIQYLAQFGLIGLSIIILFWGEFFMKHFSPKGNMKWLLYLIMVGAMFIPDIVSSRFLFVVIIMNMMEARLVKDEKTQWIETESV